MPNKFTKSPLRISDQIELLKNRGLSISDEPGAQLFLSRVSFYRFCGYGLSYEIFTDGNREEKYKESTTFDDIVSLYEIGQKITDNITRFYF